LAGMVIGLGTLVAERSATESRISPR